MRTIDTTSLQSRMNAINDGASIDVPTLIASSIESIQKALPSTELGKRLLPFIGDSLLMCMEQLKAGINDAAPSCMNTLTTDILDYALTMDASINIKSKKWQGCKQAIKNVIDTLVLEYKGKIKPETAHSDEFSENPKVMQRGLLDTAIADNIKYGKVDENLLEIAGTNAVVRKGESIQKFVRGKPVTSHPWCPNVLHFYTIADAPSNCKKVYVIDVNGIERACTSDEIADGTAWANFPDAIGTYGSQNKALLANVVDTLAKETCVPEKGHVYVGWNKTSDNKSVYLLEDGRGLNGAAYYVLNVREEIIARGKEHMSILPLEPITLEDVNVLWNWIYEASPLGHQALSIAAQFRSYLHDIHPAYTTFFLYSANEGREASRLGKTTIELASCNLSFHTHHKDTPHASFLSTQGSIEKRIARMRSSNCVIDDLNISPTSTEKDIKDAANILGMIVRATANHQEARGRLKRNLQDAESSMFEVLPCINGETIPPILASLERRMMSVEINLNDINIPKYAESWEDDMRIRLMKLGHMALRTIEMNRNEDARNLRYEIQQFEKQAEKRLKADAIDCLKSPLSQLCDDMPKVYACLLSAIWSLGKYAFNDDVGEKWSDKLYPFVLNALVKQVNRMDGKKGANDKGSLTSLLHIVRDTIASNMSINSQRYRIIARKNNDKGVEAPVVKRDDGSQVDAAYFGSKANYKTSPIFAYIDVNSEGVYVYYLTEAGYDALLQKASSIKEYHHFKTKADIQRAMKTEELLAREGKDRDVVQVRLPGISSKKHYELKLSSYLDDILKVPSENKIPSDDNPPIDLEAKKAKRNGAVSEMSIEDAEMVVSD